MAATLLERAPCFLRHTCLGSEAVYEVLEENDETVTAAVVRAPGLAAGMRVRLMARAVQAMERLDDGEVQRVRRFVPPASSGRDDLSDRVSAAISRRGALRLN
ncbi:MAG: hypothetical protein ABR946_04585 [Solirubrobacteraceae bacterium]|jgi:hypothetical protein